MWDFYEHGVIYYKNDNIYSNIIKIQRIRCQSCSSTHALLPFGITSYKLITDEIVIIIKDNLILQYKYNDDALLDIKKYCYDKTNKKLDYYILLLYVKEAPAELLSCTYLYDLRDME